MTAFELIKLFESEIADLITCTWDVENFNGLYAEVERGSWIFTAKYDVIGKTSALKSLGKKQNIWVEKQYFTPENVKFIESAFYHLVNVRLEEIEIEENERQASEESCDVWDDHGFRGARDYWTWKY